MSQPEQRRARGTAPLDGWSPSTPVEPGPVNAEVDSILSRADLAAEIAQAERVVNPMRPRVQLLSRACRMLRTPPDGYEALFAGVPQNERMYTQRVAQILHSRQDLLRKAQVMVTQFEGADRALREAQEVHAQFLVNQLEFGQVAGFQLTKFKGSVYPLYNFGTAFAGVPMLDTLLPRVGAPPPTRPLTPHTPAPTRELTPPEDPLEKLTQIVKETPQLSSIEPLLDRGLGLLRKAQEAAPGLKERGSELLKRWRKDS